MQYELVSEENRGKARVQIRKFLLSFEKSYQYEDAVMHSGVSYLPPYYIAAMPQTMQEEIRKKLTVKLTELGESSAERVEQSMRSRLIDTKDYAKWVDKEIYRNFQKRLEASKW